MDDEDFRKLFESIAELCYQSSPEVSKKLLERILKMMEQDGSRQKSDEILK